MSLDLVRREPGTENVSLVDPDSGEVVALADAPDTLIAAVLRQLKLAAEDLRDAQRGLGAVLIERMDAQASWTVGARGVKVSAPSPAAGAVTWDAELLHEILDGLVNESTLTRDAALRACSTRIEFVTHVSGIKAIEKVPGVAEKIARARREAEPKPRTITVKLEQE